MAGEIATGLLYISPDSVEMQDQLEAVPTPLVDLPYEDLCPGSAELETLQHRFR
jgi:2-oxoglutarate ferredoxin oxidoreductase subunit beta